ncbi:MAG TPA: anti-sigma factor [Gammaproteobacteria bacterium]
MSKSPIIKDEELHAYVDGRLSPQRNAEVKAYLAANPEAAEKVRVYQQQNQMMHTLFDRVLHEPLPAKLENMLPAPVPRRSYRAVAMIALSLMTGGMSGYLLRGEVTHTIMVAEPFTGRAAVAHAVYAAEILHPVEVGAENEAHLVQWLSKRLGHQLRTPDFTSFGYQLVGGRLLPGDKGAAAQFMYQTGDGARLTLYVSVKDSGMEQTAFRVQEENGQQVLYWVDDNLGFALVGEKGRNQMLDMARVAYQAMSF